MRPPFFSVVVVTWNSAEVIERCLTSIEGTAADIPHEVVVVDNASGDGTAAIVRRGAPWATVIANRANLGLAAANNQGLRATTTPRVVVCNPDVSFRPGAVAEMLAVLDRHPRAGWVVPRLLLADGTLQTSAGDPPTLADALFGRQLTRRRSTGATSGFWWDGWAHDEERPVGRGHEAAYVVRRQAVEEVGLQDERYFLDWEGMDWSDRFRRAGWETWLAPAAEVEHVGSHSIRQVPTRAIFHHHRGMYVYFADRMAPGWRPLLAGVFGARAVVKMAATAAGLPLYQWALRGRRSPGGQAGM